MEHKNHRRAVGIAGDRSGRISKRALPKGVNRHQLRNEPLERGGAAGMCQERRSQYESAGKIPMVLRSRLRLESVGQEVGRQLGWGLIIWGAPDRGPLADPMKERNDENTPSSHYCSPRRCKPWTAAISRAPRQGRRPG